MRKLTVRIKLADLLKEHGMSNRELSRLTGIRLASINEMCLNKTQRLPLENLAAICEVLGVGITDVLELVDAETENEKTTGE
ncbi:helix-turn-helix domain Cro/C1 transcriptional regulator [Paenibacillus phage Halcyone]|uniref:Helix-turn-helix domain Cro/C1 transcriptional regulator n=2 Tax=Halcyonevirus halcyone TaxID=2845737 RepID=A0A345AVP9_9CAUD|nr:transcriptional repressor [Paenibacillus phage Halcyone]AXF40982.1 helix-turn-helix domain Cro/C1 transcriptional regulator [Paenibacillus phage Heath]AXF41072.1 helix-turn-helix domain Cro/C1 transcriptional regulator [Paenibacillus phage Halcyone]